MKTTFFITFRLCSFLLFYLAGGWKMTLAAAVFALSLHLDMDARSFR